MSRGTPSASTSSKDEIAYYPILYWPVLSSQKELDDKTLAKIDAFMKQGGMIIFDTRDYGQGIPIGFSQRGSQRNQTPLQRLIGKLDIPRLEPVPQGHVLTKSFYLLDAFPGRWGGGQLWVEAGGGNTILANRKARQADGVSSILITANDFRLGLGFGSNAICRCSRWCRVASASEKWRSEPASTSQCMPSPATTRPTRCMCRLCSNDWVSSLGELERLEIIERQ